MNWDRLVASARALLVPLDREREFAVRCLALEPHEPALQRWLDRLNTERRRHLDLIQYLESTREHA